ncbi:MAG: DUF4384 domain-containing protein [Desulfobacterales bacterium]|jgi:hypothetical protein
MISFLTISIRLLTIIMVFNSLIATNYAHAQSKSLSGNLQFNYAFVALKNNGDSPQLVSVKSNHILKSGDKLKFYLEALSESYFYLFHIGPSGVLTKIFPESHQNPKLPINRKVVIPTGNRWLELDSQTGEEKFYLIASRIRQERLENLYQHYMTLKKSESAHVSIKAILDEINNIRRNNLSTSAERPVRIGGSFRGPGSKPSDPGIDFSDLAYKVSRKTAYCRVFTIDHN